MTTFPNSPRHAKGTLMLMDPDNGNITGIIPLQINPTQLIRSVKVRGAGGEGGDRSEAMRLRGSPVETIQVEAELDATDKLEFPDQNPKAIKAGVPPFILVPETYIYATSIQFP